MVRQGEAWHGRIGRARQVWQGALRRVVVSSVMAWQGRRGLARFVEVGLVEVWQRLAGGVSHGTARSGAVCRG